MAASDHQAAGRHAAPLAFDEVRWVVQIRRSLQEDAAGDDDDDDDDGIPVSVFNVPKQLHVHKPEAYTPQLIALGPYHHWRPELYEMERYKLAAARRAQRRLRAGVKLDGLVEHLARLERKVRAYYHRYLDFSGETLSWMMVVDGAFLLEFLQIYAAVAVAGEGGGGSRPLRRVSSRMAHLVDFAGRKAAHNLILRDMIMLENQVPLCVLLKILDPQCESADDAGELLARMVTGLMKELCPFKMMDSFPAANVGKHAHLLELLYYLLVPKPADDAAAEAGAHGSFHDRGEGYDIEEQPADGSGGGAEEQQPAAGSHHVKQLFVAVWGIVSRLKTAGPMKHVAKPMEVAAKAPWKMLNVVPGFSTTVASFMPGADGSANPGDPTAAGYLARPPLMEQIVVPSASELANVGVRFSPTAGDLSTIAFDAKTATFHLPVVTLDANTEVVLRNLVAYEAAAASGPLVLARYTELMNGIVDTDEDVAVLRRRGVVVNRMKNDGEAAKLWNGMTRSVRLTKVAFVDAAVDEANRYHGGRWRVKTKRFMRKYVFSSWQLLTFAAAIVMLLLTMLEAFCSVYTCSRWFGDITIINAE
ncbi:hypothetical protein ACP70R_032166 [Stipagrostis hirtigluma subsp. patula]